MWEEKAGLLKSKMTIENLVESESKASIKKVSGLWNHIVLYQIDCECGNSYNEKRKLSNKLPSIGMIKGDGSILPSKRYLDEHNSKCHQCNKETIIHLISDVPCNLGIPVYVGHQIKAYERQI